VWNVREKGVKETKVFGQASEKIGLLFLGLGKMVREAGLGECYTA
jgi:hypothetical protein